MKISTQYPKDPEFWTKIKVGFNDEVWTTPDEIDLFLMGHKDKDDNGVRTVPTGSKFLCVASAYDNIS